MLSLTIDTVIDNLETDRIHGKIHFRETILRVNLKEIIIKYFLRVIRKRHSCYPYVLITITHLFVEDILSERTKPLENSSSIELTIESLKEINPKQIFKRYFYSKIYTWVFIHFYMF
jgi:hypothetical protein